MEEKIPIALLGATGTVGQKAIALLEGYPQFVLEEVAASDGRVGRTLKDEIQWRESGALSEKIGNLILKKVSEVKSPFVLSALPASVAKIEEPLLAAAGHHVFSNASAFRLRRDVPLLIPEVNGDHLTLVERQHTPGKIVTNPNCCVAFIALALAPLHEAFFIEHVHVVTMQALSGAGYPGVSALDVTNNVIPFIPGEEEKIAPETQKILGPIDQPAHFSITVSVHRVPVMHGHLMSVHVVFRDEITPQDASEAFELWRQRFPHLFVFHRENGAPQPARHLTDNDGRVHIGRLRQGGNAHTLCLEVLGHNLVRGAAGASLANIQAACHHLSSGQGVRYTNKLLV